MKAYEKKRGHHCWWLNVDGDSITNFETDEEGIVDDIVGMAATIAQKSQELEYSADNLICEARKCESVEIELMQANKRIAELRRQVKSFYDMSQEQAQELEAKDKCIEALTALVESAYEEGEGIIAAEPWLWSTSIKTLHEVLFSTELSNTKGEG